jgi:fructose-bisphosphate aldolase, class II
VPVSLHLDHAQDEDHIREIGKTLPFDSIKVGMSHYPHEENLMKTRELSLLCRERGIAVEAESVRINGGEAGIAHTGDLVALFTTPSDLEDFLSTDIYLLAPSISNLHGDYPTQGPQLQFDRLKAIREQIADRVHLALHGTNDFSPELVRQCINAGPVKLNVNKLLLGCWTNHLREYSGGPLVALIDEGMDVLQKETERWMEVCGSVGKA